MSMEPEVMSPSSAIQMEASRRVIDRQVAENWSLDEQAGLDAWLNASVANRIAYLRAEQTWRKTARAAALRSPAHEENAGKTPPTRRLPNMGVIGALGAIALIGAGAFQYYFSGPRYTVYTTPVGGRQVLTLLDGSQVELNTDSAIRLADSKTTPEVVVDKGEVYFDMKHDPSRHFSVLANGRRISDLGTKFFVREKPGRLEVALLEGRVRLEAPDNGGHAQNLEPGDVAVATPRATTISKQAQTALSGELSWRQGVLVFYHTTLAEAAAEFNRYNDRKIVIADAKIGKLEINGTFRTNDVEMFTDVTADILGLHTEKLDGKTLMGR
jgi:transmembrane sensor